MSIMELCRLNITYNFIEDRVRLVGQSAKGEVVILWLTQRLLNRLLPELDRRARNHRASRRIYASKALAQAFHDANTQLPSVSDRMQLATANALPDMPAWRVDAVKLCQGTQQLELVFLCGGVSVAVIFFDWMMLGQWLDLLQRTYQFAGWLPAIRTDDVKEGEAPVDLGSLPEGVVLH